MNTILKQAQNVIKQEAEALIILMDKIDQSFLNAIELISNSSGNLVISGIGKSGHIGRKISSTLSSTGQRSLFIHPSEAHHGDLGMISENDILLLISNSGESVELFPVIDYAKRIGIKIISISNKKESTLAQNSDIPLILPKISEASPIGLVPTVSSTMTLALGDAIAICLLSKKGFSINDFKKLHPGGDIGNKLTFVYDIMRKDQNLPLINEQSLMDDAIVVMTKYAMGCAGITNQNKQLIGIITDGDLRRHMSNNILLKSVKEIMTKSPICIIGNVLASEALRILEEKKITSAFITENNIPIGMIHIHDLLKLKIA